MLRSIRRNKNILKKHHGILKNIYAKNYHHHNYYRSISNINPLYSSSMPNKTNKDDDNDHNAKYYSNNRKYYLKHYATSQRNYSTMMLQQCKINKQNNNNNVNNTTAADNNQQLVQKHNFHVTRKAEVWPILVAAGVIYVGARFLQKYYAAKESGELNKPRKREKKIGDKKDKKESAEDLWGGSVEFGKVTGIMGLDTGTLYSRVSVLSTDTGKVQVVENAEGQRATPSCVGVQDGDEGESSFLVGTQAETLDHIYAPNALIGRRFDDEKASAFIKDLQYEGNVKQGIGGTMQLIVGDGGEDSVASSPELLTSQLISHMRTVASSHIDTGNCSHAFLALPAEAAISPRVHSAMQIAAEQANLRLLGAAQEPLCGLLGSIASLGGMENIGGGEDGMETPSLVIICDVGRSTDVSILRIIDADDDHDMEHIGLVPHLEEHVETVYMTSDQFAGGRVFDNAIIDFLVSDFEKENKLDLTSDKMTMKRVTEAARNARIELSSKLQSEINEPFITADATGPKHLMHDMSRSKLESLSRDAMEKVFNVCKKAINESEVDKDELANAHLLVLGGMARMPSLVSGVKKCFMDAGCTDLKVIEIEQPEEMNVYGAGLKAAIKLNEINEES